MTTDLDAAIRARLVDDEFIIKGSDDGVLRPCAETDGWKAALLAVLDEHKPIEGLCDGEFICSCLPDSSDPYIAHNYPCPTVRTIAGKLGVEVDGG